MSCKMSETGGSHHKSNEVYIAFYFAIWLTELTKSLVVLLSLYKYYIIWGCVCVCVYMCVCVYIRSIDQMSNVLYCYIFVLGRTHSDKITAKYASWRIFCKHSWLYLNVKQLRMKTRVSEYWICAFPLKLWKQTNYKPNAVKENHVSLLLTE